MVVFGLANTGKERTAAPVLHVEPVLPVADVAATSELLCTVLSARVGFAVGGPSTSTSPGSCWGRGASGPASGSSPRRSRRASR
ncbi:hypothetical protein NKH77_07325 [Streptomyces sp. M19]